MSLAAGQAGPFFLALAAALLFAIGMHCINAGLRHTDGGSGALVEIATTALLYWLLAPFLLQAHYWESPAVWLFAVLGLFRPVISANLSIVGVRHLGPTLSSTLASTTPIFAAVLGVWLLGEAVSLPLALGIALSMSGVMLLTRRPGKDEATADMAGGERRWPLWALAMPVGAAAIRSTSHVFTKIGLAMLDSPWFAALLAYSVSAVMALLAVLAGNRRRGQALPRFNRGHLWFALAGGMHALAVLSLNTALLHGQVVLVTPVVSTYPFFTLLLSLLVFRRERITGAMIAGMAAVVAGVMLIAATR